MGETLFHWTRMTPSELDGAIARMPLALVPVGSLEWHGEHLACGCDHLRGEAICEAVARRLGGGVVLPGMYITAPGFCNWRGTISFSPALVKQIAAEMYRELDKCGFRYVLMLLAHAGAMQSESFEEPAEAYMRESSMRIVVRTGGAIRPGTALGGGHAQADETAELLATNPDAVRLDRYDPAKTAIAKYDGCDPALYYNGLREELHEPVRSFMAREHFRWQENLAEVVNPESAKRLFEGSCDALADELRGLM